MAVIFYYILYLIIYYIILYYIILYYIIIYSLYYIYIIILYYINGNSTISFDEIYGQDQSLFIVMSVDVLDAPDSMVGCGGWMLSTWMLTKQRWMSKPYLIHGLKMRKMCLSQNLCYLMVPHSIASSSFSRLKGPLLLGPLHHSQTH